LDVFKNKRILVTGGAGTVGKELIRHLCGFYEPKEVRVIDNNETALFFLSEEHKDDTRVNCFLGDVRDRDKLNREMQNIDIVIHTAALKHVILCERSPWDSVQSNIIGVHNLIQAAIANDVERVVFTSSDKAVNPTNVMGTSKLMGERLITSANAKKFNGHGPIFSSIRFGNVLGSRGSVVPVFKEQIAGGGPVTITDRRMTRFFMSLSQAITLVLKSVELARGGEVFITKMPVARIEDLARVMIDILAPSYGFRPRDIQVIEIGAKPGEKLYEELMNEEEIRRTLELKNHFVVLPAFRSVYEDIQYDYPDIVSLEINKPYNSSLEEPVSLDYLCDFLITHGLVDNQPKNTGHGFIPAAGADSIFQKEQKLPCGF